jgi:IS5 family transposase
MTPSKKIKGVYFSFADTLDAQHPLFILANTINWHLFEAAFEPLCCSDNGRHGKPIHLMLGLLFLKHIRTISDERVVEQWAENNYDQYFCGETSFVLDATCEASEHVHFRNRISGKVVNSFCKRV